MTRFRWNSDENSGTIHIGLGTIINQLTIMNSDFSFNTGTTGGIYLGGTLKVLNMYNMTAANNVAQLSGGKWKKQFYIRIWNLKYHEKSSKFRLTSQSDKFSGVLFMDSTSLTLLNIQSCSFRSNRALYGGALYLNNFDSRSVLDNNNVLFNSATYYGGAIYIQNSLDPVIFMEFSLSNFCS